MDLIEKYFGGELSELQRSQLAALPGLYAEWNAKINVVSRRDIDNLMLHHVLHSLALARVFRPHAGSAVLDFGTGGGFPGVPLAIMFPDVNFLLVDSVGKKLTVVRAVSEAVGLTNVETLHARAESIKDRQFDYVVSRAVMPLGGLVRLARPLISRTQRGALPNGVLALKGGDLTEEIGNLKSRTTVWNISDEFDEDFFETKRVVHVAITS